MFRESRDCTAGRADPREKAEKPLTSSGERRVAILDEHQTLRRMVQDLFAAADLVTSGNDAEGEPLHAQLVRLCFALDQHLLHEEDLLEPVFARSDGTGARYLARMNLEHARQRAVLGRLRAGLGGRMRLPALAASTAAMGRALLAEMDEEEDQLLSLEALGRAPATT
jgi:iron-sulfur cluster repair protein YtfE (RIC family)